MLGLEMVLQKLIGGNDALLMWGAFSLLIFLNFITEMWVEIRKKDLKWNDLARFGKPIFLNTMFLLGLELVMIPAKRLPLAYDIFANIQFLGWLGAMGIYFFGFYKNLKKLGLQANKRLDRAIEDIEQLDNKEDGQ